MSKDFDPFSGNNSYYSDSYKDKPNKHNNQMITVILVILLIGFGIYYAVSFLFLNQVEVSFDVKNTEGDVIPSVIRISKDPMITNVIKTLSNNEITKIKKGNYHYSVQATGYNQLKKEIDLKSTKIKLETVTLEKNIPINIKNIVFPEKVYVGQTAILEIYYENTSQTTTYNVDDLIIEGDIKEWDFITVDFYNDPISKQDALLYPLTEDKISLRYIVQDTKKKTNNISVRVKYKEQEKKINFEIIEEPNVPITGNLSGEIKSGENKNYNITINNSRNKISIPDLTLSLEITSNNNEDVNSWFTYPLGNIFVDASKNETKSISISVPQTARDDSLEGKLIFNSSVFREVKEIPITITIKEPNISFTTSLNKTDVKLKYDVNNNVTNVEILRLTLDNKSTIDIDIASIEVLDLDPIRKDCNNFIFISENALLNMKVNRNTKPEILVNVSAIDPNLIGNLINNIRMCNIVVEYKHPFRMEETNIITNNLTITVE